MTGKSAWRVNDVVVYDAMRDSASMLLSLLVNSSTADQTGRDSNAREIESLRNDVLSVQAYDRASVSSLSARIEDRIAQLTEAHQ